MKYLKFLFLVVIVGCSSPRIVYDYDTQLNFNQYKTFNFFEDVGEGLNKFDVARITKEIKLNLEKQGLQQTENPDFYINVLSVVKRQNRSNSSVGVSVGGGNRGFGYGISTGVPIGARKMNQQITIDFVASKNNGLIWQSISDSEIKENLRPNERDAYYKNLVQKIIEGFPPKKESK